MVNRYFKISDNGRSCCVLGKGFFRAKLVDCTTNRPGVVGINIYARIIYDKKIGGDYECFIIIWDANFNGNRHFYLAKNAFRA
jgi:hypothetical protein